MFPNLGRLIPRLADLGTLTTRYGYSINTLLPHISKNRSLCAPGRTVAPTCRPAVCHEQSAQSRARHRAGAIPALLASYPSDHIHPTLSPYFSSMHNTASGTRRQDDDTQQSPSQLNDMSMSTNLSQSGSHRATTGPTRSRAGKVCTPIFPSYFRS